MKRPETGKEPVGYRGPGTDLGEDIRRGHVDAERAGPGGAQAPPPEHGLRSGAWGERLRKGWRGLMRRRRP